METGDRQAGVAAAAAADGLLLLLPGAELVRADGFLLTHVVQHGAVRLSPKHRYRCKFLLLFCTVLLLQTFQMYHV